MEKSKVNSKFYGAGAESNQRASRPFGDAKRKIEATTELCRALRAREFERAKDLMTDAILDAVDENGATPLMYAVLVKDTPMVRALLAAGATLDYQEKTFGSTALMCAAQLQDREMFSTLVMLGADPGIANKKGRTARDVLRHPEKDDAPFWNFRSDCVIDGF
ncbi:MAG: ankyrin repeat domain-containing protein [Candidatus Micrarchaeia archaeon]